MTFNSGTATDYIDMLDQLIEVVTSRHVASVVVNAAGSSYVAGDILTVAGGTSTHVAQIEVLTVDGGGAITSERVYRGGAYTVDPTTTANAVTGGTGSSATYDLTMAETGWTQLTRESELDTADSIAAGGTGYSIGDDLTLVGGVLAPGGAAATLNVDTLSGSAVATVSILTRGDYEVFPTDPVQTTVSPAGGTGCTLNLTPRDVTGDTIVVLQGDAGAATDPLVGIKTYSSELDETGLNTVYNWAMFGMSSWSSALALHNQANISDGFGAAGAITSSTTGDGAFLPQKNSATFDYKWWIAATGRRVVLVTKVSGTATDHYAHASFGLFNQFGVTTELPFPSYVAAASDRKKVWYRDTGSIFGGLTEVIERANGPFFVWSPQGAWLGAKNAQITSNTSTTPTYSAENDAPRCNIWPLGPSIAHTTADDVIWAIAGASGFDNDDLSLTSGAVSIYRTPDTGGDLFPLYPVTAVQADSATMFFRTFGEVEGLFWVHEADATLSSEDRFTQGSDAYTVFQNGTRVQPYSYLALRED